MSTASANIDTRFWEPKRSLTLAAARRHSSHTKLFRAILMFMAAALFAVLVYFIIDGPDAPTVVADETESVRMTNPRYTDVDGDGEPYTLTADYAVRSRDNLSAVKLVNPILNFTRIAEADPSKMVAKDGLYDSKAQVMELRTDVVVTTDDGYVCETTHARILAGQKTVQGDEPISCTGDFGNVRGDRYEILDDYSRFIFYGNVSGLIVPKPSDSVDSQP